jgi:predicted amidohydrolase
VTFAAKPLETFRLGGVVIGGLICNDLWANPECTPQDDPHLTRRLARMGAEVILHSVNAAAARDEFYDTYHQFHEANLRMRARASRLWIVSVDNCHPAPSAPVVSPSGIVGPDGHWLVKAPSFGERFFSGRIAIPGRTVDPVARLPQVARVG